MERIGISLNQTDGDTNCDSARSLHFDAMLNLESSSQLGEILLTAKRAVGHCTRGQMVWIIGELLQRAPAITSAPPGLVDFDRDRPF